MPGAGNHFSVERSFAERATLVGQDPDRIAACPDPGLDGSLPARRPAYSALDNSVLRSLGHPGLRDHRDAVAEAVARAVG